MVYSEYCKLRILYLRRQGYGPTEITRLLQAQRLKVSSRGVAKFLKRFRETGKEVLHSFTQGSFEFPARNHLTSSWQWQRSVITEEVKNVVEQQMRRDD